MKRALASAAGSTLSKKPKSIRNERLNAGILLRYRDSIFMVQPTGSSGFGIPKGYVEEGETLEAGARREFKEETGIDVSTIPLKYLEGSGEIKNGKKIHAFIGDGNGTEQYVSSNLITKGFRAGEPENSGGRYFTIKEALKVVHKNQLSLIKMYEASCSPLGTPLAATDVPDLEVTEIKEEVKQRPSILSVDKSDTRL